MSTGSQPEAEKKRKSIKEISPIDVYKLLPRTNCGECGEANCMAFATRLVNGELLLADCPPLYTAEYQASRDKLSSTPCTPRAHRHHRYRRQRDQHRREIRAAAPRFHVPQPDTHRHRCPRPDAGSRAARPGPPDREVLLQLYRQDTHAERDRRPFGIRRSHDLRERRQDDHRGEPLSPDPLCARPGSHGGGPGRGKGAPPAHLCGNGIQLEGDGGSRARPQGPACDLCPERSRAAPVAR